MVPSVAPNKVEERNHTLRERARESVRRSVFEATDPVVVALTGGWGEGKTYFWKEVILLDHSKREAGLTAGQRQKEPGFVSVFGAASIAEIRERVVLATFPPAEQGGNWLEKGWAAAKQKTGIFANAIIEKIGLPTSLAVEVLQRVRLSAGWVLCIDDVERLSKDDVGYDNFLGFVTELRDKWKLRVVLIFNKQKIDSEAGSAFQLYQEKVIDREIPFALDLQDIVDLVFHEVNISGFDAITAAKERCEILNLRNIRILRRARSYFLEAQRDLPYSVPPEYLQTVLASIILFAYVRFANPKFEGLTFEMLKDYSEFRDRLEKEMDSKAEPNSLREEAAALLSRYRYTATDALDLVLMEFVQSDVLNGTELRAQFALFQAAVARSKAERRLRDVWDKHYHGTLADNSAQLINELEDALRGYMEYIPPGELDSVLSTIEALGQPNRALQLFDEFKDLRGAQFEKLDAESRPHHLPTYGPLKSWFEMYSGDSVDSRTLEDVMATAFDDGMVRHKDAERISQFSVDELVSYFSTHDQASLTSKIRELAKTGNTELRRIVFETAAKIAELSELNRLRMKGMGLLKGLPPKDEKPSSNGT
jgi:hypothetical protein